MRQEEIVNEIRKKCANVEMLPSMGWHFICHDRHFFYMTGKGEGMVHLCVPHLVKHNEYCTELLSVAVNETNRNVMLIKEVTPKVTTFFS